MPELGSAVFRIFTDARDFDKDLDKAERRANKAAGSMAKSFGSADDAISGTRGQLHLFDEETAHTEQSTAKLNNEVKRSGGVLGGLRATLTRVTSGYRAHRTEVEKTTKSHDGFLKKVISVNAVTKLLGNTIRVIKWPAMIAGAGMAVQALAALTAGATALVGALAPLSGALVAFPSILTAVGQGLLTVKLATKGLDKALGATTRSGYLAAMKQLTPQAREFVRTLKDMKPRVKELREEAQKGLFSGATKGLKAALTNFGIFRTAIADTGKTIGGLAKTTGEMIGSKAFGSDFAKISKQNQKTLRDLGMAALNLVFALQQVLVAGRPFVSWLTGSARKLAEHVAALSLAGRQTGRLNKFFDQTRGTLQRVFSIVGKVSGGLYNIGKLGADAGRDLLRSLDIAAGHFKNWTDSTRGQNAIKKYFENIVPTVEAMGRLVRDITREFFKLGSDQNLAPLLDQIRTQLLPVLSSLFSSTAKALGPALVNTLTQVGRLIAVFAGNSGPLQNFVSLLGIMAGALADLLESNPALQTMAVTWIGMLGVMKVANFAGAISGVSTLIKYLKEARLAALGLTAAEEGAGAAAGLGSIGLVVAGIAAVAGGLYVLYHNSATAKRIMDDVWTTMRETAVTVWGAINHEIDKHAKLLRDLGNIAQTTFAFIAGTIGRVIPGIVMQLKGFANILGGLFKIFTGLITGDFGKMWDGIKQVFSGGVTAVLGTLRTATAPMRQAASMLWSPVASAATTAWNAAKSVFRSGLGAVLGLVTTYLGVLGSMASGFVKAFGWVPGVGSKLKQFRDAIKSAQDRIDSYRESLRKTGDVHSHQLSPIARLQSSVSNLRDRLGRLKRGSDEYRDTAELLRRKQKQLNETIGNADPASRRASRAVNNLGINFSRLRGTVGSTASYITAATNQVLSGLGAKTIRFSLQRASALQGYGGTSSHATGGIPNTSAGAADDHLLISPSGRPVAAMSGSEGIVNTPQMSYINSALSATSAMGMGPYGSLGDLWGSGMTHKRGGPLKFAKGGQLPGGNILELLWKVPGHFDHLHVAMQTGIVALGKKLQAMGYQVGEHPAFGGVGGSHVRGSYHYSGKAIDVNADGKPGGEAKWLNRLYAMLKSGRLAGIADQIGKVTVNGPAGMMKNLAQGAADKMRAAANAKIQKVIGSMGVGFGSDGAFGKAQLMALWRGAGGPGGAVANTAAAIALAESRGNPRARNASGASGLWQILGQVVRGNIFNPVVNARNAVKKWRDAGNSFRPWTTYTGADTPGHAKTYMQYLRKGGPVGRIAKFAKGKKPAKPKHITAGRPRAGINPPGIPPRNPFTRTITFRPSFLNAGVIDKGRVARGTTNAALGAASDDLAGERAGLQTLVKGLGARIKMAQLILKSGKATNPLAMKNALADLMNQQKEATARIKELNTTIREAGPTTAAAEARLTKSLDDDVAAARDLVNIRQQEYNEAKASGNAEAITNAANNLADAQGSLEGIQSQMPTRDDYVGQQIAQARLTAATEDDIAAQNALLQLRRDQYSEAIAMGDPRAIADAANALADVQDQVSQQSADLAQELKSLNENLAQQNEHARQVMSVSTGAAWQAMAAAISGRTGSNFAARRRTAGFGTVASY